jgi:hypothetical protein
MYGPGFHGLPEVVREDVRDHLDEPDGGEVAAVRKRHLAQLRRRIEDGSYLDERNEALAIERLLDTLLAG